MDILVKPDQLRKTGSNIENSAKNINRAMENLDQIMRALGPSQFEGMNAGELRQRYAVKRDLLRKAPDTVNRFAATLVQLADRFEQADRRLTGGANASLLSFKWLPNFAGILGSIGITWPPKFILFPNLNLPNAPWNPTPVYAPGPILQTDAAPTEAGEITSGATSESLPLNENATTGFEKCVSYVRDQRKFNNMKMPSGMSNPEGFYSGNYTGEGSFVDTDGKTFEYGQEPRLGAIMVENPDQNPKINYGHLSIINGVQKDGSGKVYSFTVAETSWGEEPVHNETFLWDEAKQRYVSPDGRVYDSFVY
jgi:surface antigen